MTLTALDFLVSDCRRVRRRWANCVAGQANVQRLGSASPAFRGRDHAVRSDLHRRSGARRVRSAQDVSIGRPMDANQQPLLDVRDLSVHFISPAELRSRSTASPSRSSAASVWRWSANPVPEIGQRAVDPQAAAYPTASASVGQHSLQGPRTARPVGARDPRHSRQRHSIISPDR